MLHDRMLGLIYTALENSIIMAGGVIQPRISALLVFIWL